MLRVVIEELVPDGLWEQVAPLLPAPKPRPYRHHGRRRADDRAALAGIVFVLRHGVGWAQVPRAALGVSGVTCWRRLREWALIREVTESPRRIADDLPGPHFPKAPAG